MFKHGPMFMADACKAAFPDLKVRSIELSYEVDGIATITLAIIPTDQQLARFLNNRTQHEIKGGLDIGKGTDQTPNDAKDSTR